ncbi:MAG: hypothetical protein Q8M19_21380 [Reyranella sp.]|nr:hypothetical protein [Reyranella sp.]
MSTIIRQAGPYGHDDDRCLPEQRPRRRRRPTSGPPCRALGWARRGDWGRAHECVQSHEGEPDCDRVHAHLHRQEGDMSNAGWWYRRVGRPVPVLSLEEEWNSLAAEMLARK